LTHLTYDRENRTGRNPLLETLQLISSSDPQMLNSMYSTLVIHVMLCKVVRSADLKQILKFVILQPESLFRWEALCVFSLWKEFFKAKEF